MVFENQILRPAPLTALDTLAAQFRQYGIQLLGYTTLDTVDETVREIAAQLLLRHTAYSDLLSFLAAAGRRSATILRYTLQPPYTTSRLDCEQLGQMLVRLHVLEDISYSTQSGAFWIQLEPHPPHTIAGLLRIGLAERLWRSGQGWEVVCDVTLEEAGSSATADVALRRATRLFLLHIKTAAGLAADLPSHRQQLDALASKIFRRQPADRDVQDIYFVAPHTARLLPYSRRIVPLDGVEDWILGEKGN